MVKKSINQKKGRCELDIHPKYPQELALAPCLAKYKPPLFEKYDGVEGNAREHVTRYIDALGTFASNCDLRLREFSKSLSSYAYT